MQPRNIAVVCAAVACLLLCVSCHPQKPSPSGHVKFEFKTPGSAKGLGVSKLARIQRRSGLSHLTLDQLAKEIESDDDLVSPTFERFMYLVLCVSCTLGV
jgi:hypothetical protein